MDKSVNRMRGEGRKRRREVKRNIELRMRGKIKRKKKKIMRRANK